MEWNDETVIKLCLSLEKFECLYNVQSPEYKNRVLRKEALETIAQELDGIAGKRAVVEREYYACTVGQFRIRFKLVSVLVSA